MSKKIARKKDKPIRTLAQQREANAAAARAELRRRAQAVKDRDATEFADPPAGRDENPPDAAQRAYGPGHPAYDQGRRDLPREFAGAAPKVGAFEPGPELQYLADEIGALSKLAGLVLSSVDASVERNYGIRRTDDNPPVRLGRGSIGLLRHNIDVVRQRLQAAYTQALILEQL